MTGATISIYGELIDELSGTVVLVSFCHWTCMLATIKSEYLQIILRSIFWITKIAMLKHKKCLTEVLGNDYVIKY